MAVECLSAVEAEHFGTDNIKETIGEKGKIEKLLKTEANYMIYFCCVTEEHRKTSVNN